MSLREHPNWSRVTPLGWAAAVYIAIVSTTAAYLPWFRTLRLFPASTAATGVLLAPVVGMFGSAMLGEPLGVRQIGALAMTLAGIALAVRT
jgi:drug/metabolite transporter (DMT)-like permease